ARAPAHHEKGPLARRSPPAGGLRGSKRACARAEVRTRSRVYPGLLWSEGAGLEPEPAEADRMRSHRSIAPCDLNPPPRHRRYEPPHGRASAVEALARSRDAREVMSGKGEQEGRGVPARGRGAASARRRDAGPVQEAQAAEDVPVRLVALAGARLGRAGL